MKKYILFIIALSNLISACSNRKNELDAEIKKIRQETADMIKQNELGGQPGSILISQNLSAEKNNSKVKIKTELIPGKNPDGELSKLTTKLKIIESSDMSNKLFKDYLSMLNEAISKKDRIVYKYINCSESQLSTAKDQLVLFQNQEIEFIETDFFELLSKRTKYLPVNSEIFEANNLILCGHLSQLESDHEHVHLRANRIVLINSDIEISSDRLSQINIYTYQLFVLGENRIKNLPKLINYRTERSIGAYENISIDAMDLQGNGSLEIRLEGYSQTRN